MPDETSEINHDKKVQQSRGSWLPGLDLLDPGHRHRRQCSNSGSPEQARSTFIADGGRQGRSEQRLDGACEELANFKTENERLAALAPQSLELQTRLKEMESLLLAIRKDLDKIEERRKQAQLKLTNYQKAEQREYPSGRALGPPPSPLPPFNPIDPSQVHDGPEILDKPPAPAVAAAGTRGQAPPSAPSGPGGDSHPRGGSRSRGGNYSGNRFGPIPSSRSRFSSTGPAGSNGSEPSNPTNCSLPNEPIPV